MQLQFKTQIKDFDGLHDVMLEIDGKSRTPLELLEIFNSLPFPIQNMAHTWSCSDTVFRDEAFRFLEERYKEQQDK